MRVSMLLAFLASLALNLTAQQPAEAAKNAAATEESRVTEDESARKQKLEESIVVTATRSEREVSELPVSTTVIGRAKIETAPVKGVDDLIRSVPGVVLPVTNSSVLATVGSSFSMRGLGGTRALLLLDGIPIHDPYQGTVQWAKVPLDGLRQVEVVRGASASLFGNYAVGGAVNLLTRPVETSQVRFDTSLGTFGTDRVMLSVDHLVSPRLGLRLSHSRFDSEGYYRQPVPGPVDIPGWNDTSTTGARAEITLSDATRGFVKADWSSIEVSQGTPLSANYRDLFALASGFQHAVGDRGLVSATVFRQTSEEHGLSSRVPVDRTSETLSADSIIPSSATGASVEWSMQRTGAVPFLSFGVDVQRIEAEERRDNYTRGVVSSKNLIQGAQQFAGVFGQASWRPSTRLEILTSARIDYYRNFDGQDAVVGGAVKTYEQSTSTELDPRVSFRYSLGDRSALRGAVYRGFKAPTLRSLYRNSIVGTTTILANPDLEPETLAGAELGFERVFAGGRVEANVYRNDIEGIQVRSQVPGQPPNVLQEMNLGKARSQGVELMASFELRRSLALDASYTWSDSTVVEDPDPALVGKIIPDVITHFGTLALRYRAGRGTSLVFATRVAGRSYGDAANSVPAPAHIVFDLSLSHPLRPWLDVYGLLENAGDKLYYQVLSSTSFRVAQPRSFTGGLRIRLGAHG